MDRKIYGSGLETGYVVTGTNPSVIDINKFNSKYYQTFGPFTFRPYSITRFVNSFYGYTQIFVSDYSSTNIIELFRYTTGSYNGEGVAWGFSSEPVPVSSDLITRLTSSSTPVNLAKKVDDLYGGVNNQAQKITKLYGSINGQTKLIHQGFGHVDHGYGYVEYYTDNNRTTTGAVVLQSQADVNLLGNGSTSWSVTLGGVTITNQNIKEVSLTKKVTSLPQNFLHYATYLDKVDIANTRISAIPDTFVNYCGNFNSEIVIPSTVTSIGNSFMRNNASFNQPITLPDGMTSIGHSFLSCATTVTGSFCQNISLPASLTSIDTDFLYNQENMTAEVNVGSLDTSIFSTASSYTFSTYSSTDPAYTQGIKIAGANRAAWMVFFPNRTSRPYRNLVDAGY